MTQRFRQQRLQRRKWSPLQCIVYIVGFLLLQLSVTGIRKYEDRLLDPFIDNCVFSDTAITPDRIARTERAIQVGAFPSATLKCAHSSGTMRIVKAPPRFGGERLAPSRPTPAHGEHTESVLNEFGLDEKRIEALRSEGVLGEPHP